MADSRIIHEGAIIIGDDYYITPYGVVEVSLKTAEEAQQCGWKIIMRGTDRALINREKKP